MTTVKELITELEKYPPNMEVEIDIEDGGYSDGITTYQQFGLVYLGNIYKKDGTPPET